MDSFKKNFKKRDLWEYYYWILDIPITPKYLPTQSQDEGEKESSISDFGESSDELKVVGEEDRT